MKGKRLLFSARCVHHLLTQYLDWSPEVRGAGDSYDFDSVVGGSRST